MLLYVPIVCPTADAWATFPNNDPEKPGGQTRGGGLCVRKERWKSEARCVAKKTDEAGGLFGTHLVGGNHN